jgi:hypothetical protein
MRLNQRRIVLAVVGEEEALAVVAAAVASAVAVVEDAQAAVVAVDVKAEAEAAATIIKAMRGSPENHAGSLSTPVKYDSSLPTMKK